MTNFDLHEIEELLIDDSIELTPKTMKKTITRKWREIEAFKETQRLHRELLQYSIYDY